VPDAVADPVPDAVADVVPEPSPPSAHLRVIAGPMEGQEVELGDELLIGRGYGEPGALGGDRLLSRRHARIARGPGGAFYIQDTGSTNGTSVNGKRVRGALALKEADEIEVGSSTLVATDVPGAPLTPELTGGPAGAGGRGWRPSRRRARGPVRHGHSHPRGRQAPGFPHAAWSACSGRCSWRRRSSRWRPC